MLTEYALTPHLFDDLHNVADPEWLDRLRAFGDRLLPVGQERVFNTVISNLYGASWHACEFVPLIENLERRQDADRAKKLPALDLLKQLRPRVERFLVGRPASNDDFPQDEAGWVEEAFGSASRTGLPIHRVVASSGFQCDPAAEERPVLLRETQEEAFWESVPTTQWPRADLAEQRSAIRRMCTFYGFLAFVSPHIDVQGSTDLRFVIEMVRAAFSRPAGFPPPARIDLHSKGPPEERLRQPLVDRVRERLRTELGDQANVIRLYLWRTGLERHLLVGHARAEKPAVVWAVSLTHVVRPDRDGPDQDNATFALLPASKASKLASRYYSNASRQPYDGSPFAIR